MRHLLLTLAVLALAVAAVADDDAVVPRTTIGDVPRTYTHFMNAQEAALCRANVAAGGLSAYFFNPAVIGGLDGVSGMATMRMNLKTRDYLPEGTDTGDNLEASDDAFLFSQAVASKRSDSFALGLGYSCPSYRRLELSGRLDGSPYTGEFTGSLRFFEIVGATSIGTEGQGVIGIALGLANLAESATEKAQRFNRSASMDGFATSLAIGMTFGVGERLTVGAGYRFSTVVDVEGESLSGSVSGATSGTTRTEPVAVGGVRFEPTDSVTLYASYIYEGWGSAESSFAAYYPIVEDDTSEESEGRRDEFDSALTTAAVGGEVALMDDRVTLRAGFSMPVGSDFSNEDEPDYRELAPEYAAGFGGTMRFSEYYVDAAFVMERYADGDESEQATNNGVYLTVGYEF